jgi:O-antigen/teichoic acid export membrane protein
MTSITKRAMAFKDRRSRGQHRRGARGPLAGRLRGLVAESLVRNSAFLVANLVLSAVCGFGALILFTHLYSVEAVGLTAAALSAGGLISFITQFGASYSLPRFLPTSAHRTDLINTVLTVTMLATLVGAGVFLTLPVATKLFALGGAFFAVTFVFATTLDAGQTELEAVLVADRAAHKITTANIVTNVVKLAAPAAFVFLGMSGAYIARMADTVASFIVLAVVIARRGHHFRPTFSAAATRGLRRFTAGAYIASQIGSLPLLLLPLIILNRFGSTQNAYWFTAMAVASFLYQLPGCVAQALLPEASHRPGERRALIRRSAALIALVSLPMYAIAYLLAPAFLAVLGGRYAAESLAPLHWLIFAGAISSLNYITGTVIYLAKKTFILAVINGVDAVIILVLAVTWASDINDVAICWLLGEFANVTLFALFAALSLRQVQGRWEALGGDDAQP